MKFTAAAILAIGAAATKISQYGSEGDLPYPPPDCKKMSVDTEGVEPEDVFDAVDYDDSGYVDAQEGFNALFCMVEAGELTREEAEIVFEYLGGFAGDDKLLSRSEADAAFYAYA